MCKANQPSLFDFIESMEHEPITQIANNIEVKELDEKELKEILTQMKKYIDDETLIKSDFYFNICYWRPYTIKECVLEKGIYELKFASVSDSERLLTAYELRPIIQPLELLNTGIADGAKTMIKRYIEDYPKTSTKQLLEHFRIFEYPHYYTRAKSSNKEELELVADLLIRFAKLRELLNLKETRFSFMREKKRTKLEDQINTIPRCFDGLCLEANMMKILSNVNKNM